MFKFKAISLLANEIGIQTRVVRYLDKTKAPVEESKLIDRFKEFGLTKERLNYMHNPESLIEMRNEQGKTTYQISSRGERLLHSHPLGIFYNILR